MGTEKIDIAGKYRPRKLLSMIGQDSVKKILKNKMKDGKLSHGMLFYGERGTGKTTTARILASWMNCLNPSEDGPCCTCKNCQAILDESCPDVIELDAAGHNKVADMEDIIDKLQYVPQMVEKKVVILDEVHELSASAFDKMLKIFEEPPAYVYFILCTTELKKVPKPIQSRMEKIPFKTVEEPVLADNIKAVCEKEGAVIDDEAAALIAKLARGSVRDSMTLLQPLLGLSPITAEIVREVNALTTDDDNLSVVQGLLYGDANIVASVVSSIDINAVPALLKAVIETIGLILYKQFDAKVLSSEFVEELAESVDSNIVNDTFCKLSELIGKNSYFILGKLIQIASEGRRQTELEQVVSYLMEEVQTLKQQVANGVVSVSISDDGDNESGSEELEKMLSAEAEAERCPFEDEEPAAPIPQLQVGEEIKLNIGEPISLNIGNELKVSSAATTPETAEEDIKLKQGPKMSLTKTR